MKILYSIITAYLLSVLMCFFRLIYIRNKWGRDGDIIYKTYNKFILVPIINLFVAIRLLQIHQ